MDILLAELAVIVVMTCIVGTFSPTLQEKLPWGRAYRRFCQSRMAAQMRALEVAAFPPPKPASWDDTSPYRGAISPPVRQKTTCKCE